MSNFIGFKTAVQARWLYLLQKDYLHSLKIWSNPITEVKLPWKPNAYRHSKTTELSAVMLTNLGLKQKNPFENSHADTKRHTQHQHHRSKHILIFNKLLWISRWHAPVFCLQLITFIYKKEIQAKPGPAAPEGKPVGLSWQLAQGGRWGIAAIILAGQGRKGQDLSLLRREQIKTVCCARRDGDVVVGCIYLSLQCFRCLFFCFPDLFIFLRGKGASPA